MELQRAATMRQVTHAFEAWKVANDRIKNLESVIRSHEDVRDARSAELKLELIALQREAEQLLLVAQRALLNIKTPRSGSGDSTWG